MFPHKHNWNIVNYDVKQSINQQNQLKLTKSSEYAGSMKANSENDKATEK